MRAETIALAATLLALQPLQGALPTRENAGSVPQLNIEAEVATGDVMVAAWSR